MAQEINNTTDSIQNTSYKLDYTLSKSNNDLISTHIDVVSNNTFDVKGDYFKVKLSDKNNNSIKNAQIVFFGQPRYYEKKAGYKAFRYASPLLFGRCFGLLLCSIRLRCSEVLCDRKSVV